MKVLDLDGGLAARKQLAQELHYTGALDGSGPSDGEPTSGLRIGL
jgi:hypothetical protein